MMRTSLAPISTSASTSPTSTRASTTRLSGTASSTSCWTSAVSFSRLCCTFRCLILCPGTTFIQEFSNTTAFGKDEKGVTRLELVQGCISEYLTSLSNSGYTVIQSLPYLSHPEMDRTSCAFTSLAFQVVSKDTITIHNWTHEHSIGEAPVLLIYGMCGGRAMPSTLVQWLLGFIVPGGKRRTFGTISLSREIFLEGRLLSLLEVVNRRTTLVPN